MGKWNNRWIPNQRGYRHDNRGGGGGGGRLPPPYPAATPSYAGAANPITTLVQEFWKPRV